MARLLTEPHPSPQGVTPLEPLPQPPTNGSGVEEKEELHATIRELRDLLEAQSELIQEEAERDEPEDTINNEGTRSENENEHGDDDTPHPTPIQADAPAPTPPEAASPNPPKQNRSGFLNRLLGVR